MLRKFSRRIISQWLFAHTNRNLSRAQQGIETGPAGTGTQKKATRCEFVVIEKARTLKIARHPAQNCGSLQVLLLPTADIPMKVDRGRRRRIVRLLFAATVCNCCPQVNRNHTNLGNMDGRYLFRCSCCDFGRGKSLIHVFGALAAF